MDEEAPVLLLHEAVLLLPHCAVVVALQVVVVVAGGLQRQSYHTIITIIIRAVNEPSRSFSLMRMPTSAFIIN